MLSSIHRIEIILGWAIVFLLLFCLSELFCNKFFKWRDLIFPPIIVFKYRDLKQKLQRKPGRLYYFIWLIFILYILTGLIGDLYEAYLVSDGLFSVSLLILPTFSVVLIFLMYLFSKKKYI
jgi:hypothetical protein